MMSKTKNVNKELDEAKVMDKEIINLINFIHINLVCVWRRNKETFACIDHHRIPEFLEAIGYDCDADGGLDVEMLCGGDIVINLCDTVCDWYGVECNFLDGVIDLYDR